MRAALLIALALLSTLTAGTAQAASNGDLLLIERNRAHFDGSAALLRIDPDSGRVTRTLLCAENDLVAAPQPRCNWAGPPSVSPDGGSIAFATSDPTGPYPYGNPPTFSVRVLNLASGQWRQVELGAGPLAYETPVSWMPDGDVVVLAPRRASDPLGPKDALLAGPDGPPLRPLISNVSGLDVAGDGRIAFIRGGALRLRNPDGSSRRLTKRGGSRPSWSPHAKSIAYTLKGWVYTVSSRGGHPRRLTRGFEPAWSPDGKWIAFFRADPSREYFGDDATYLYALNRRTGRVRRVSSHLMALEGANDSATGGIDWLPAR